MEAIYFASTQALLTPFAGPLYLITRGDIRSLLQKNLHNRWLSQLPDGEHDFREWDLVNLRPSMLPKATVNGY